MRKAPALLLILFLSITCFLRAQESSIIPGNLLVMLRSDVNVKKLSHQLYQLGGIPTKLKMERILSSSMHIYLFRFDASAINQERMLAALRNHPYVKIVQYDHVFQERAIPNDTKFNTLWDMNNTGQSGGTADADIDAPEAWDITTGGLTPQGDTIVVAVIDRGFDISHEDLSFWKNYQEIPNNGIDDDNNGYVDDHDGWNGSAGTDRFSVEDHGTHVSGTIGAKGNNGIGVTGVNWNVKVMPLSYGSGNLESAAIACYSYARDQRRLYNQTNGARGAFIVSTNSSFGVDYDASPTPGIPANFPLWCAIYDSLGKVGILSAAATTNSNINVDAKGDIPTACTSDWLITVNNTTRNDTKASSGYGATSIDLGAPGSGITSTYPSNSYFSSTGTSMATPHVAGAIALMYSVPCPALTDAYKTDPGRAALMIKDSLLKATDPVSSLSGVTVTGGRLNLYKAVRSIQNYCMDVSVTDVEPLNAQLEIKNVYPNPTMGIIDIMYNSNEPVNISIVNVLGQEVKHLRDAAAKGIQHVSVDLSSIEKGIYFVSIYSNNKRSNVVKVLIY